MFTRTSLLLAWAAVSLAHAQPAEDKLKKELAALQGVWRLIGFEVDGKEALLQEDKQVRWVIKDDKVTKHFYFRFTLIFDDTKNRDKTSAVLSALTNDFVVELSQLLTRKLVEESNYDPNLIQQQLQKVCDRRLGKGVVTQVSITNMEQAE